MNSQLSSLKTKNADNECCKTYNLESVLIESVNARFVSCDYLSSFGLG